MSIRSELDALRQVARAARLMPRKTPEGGAAGTLHAFRIMAADVWCLDSALTDLDAALENKKTRKGRRP